MFKEPGPGNTTRIFYYRRQSAASTLRPEPFESLQAKYLFVTGITPALSDSNRKLTFELVDKFRAAGTKIAFDPNMRFRLWSADEARSVFLELARKSDVLIPSLVEAEILTGLKEGESHARRTSQAWTQLRLSLRPETKALGTQTAQNADSVLATRFQRSIRSERVMRSARDSFPDCSMVKLFERRSSEARRSARSACPLLATTRACPLGLSSKPLWKEKLYTADNTCSQDPKHMLRSDFRLIDPTSR